MWKLVNYRCSNCKKVFQEEWFKRGEKIPRYLKKPLCLDCGGTFEIWNFKNNKQQWTFMDKRP